MAQPCFMSIFDNKMDFRLYPNDMTKISHDGKLSNADVSIDKQQQHPQKLQQLIQQQNIVIQRPPVSPTCVGGSRKRKSLCTT